MRPLLYRTLLRRAALMFGLAGLCAGAALVLGADRIGSRTGQLADHKLVVVDRDWSDITGSTGGSLGLPSRSLPLTDEQRGHIFDGIMKLRDAPVADVPPPPAASALPHSVTLQELPASVTHEVPLVQGYKFVKLDDRILLVSPIDRSVVAEMPRYHMLVD
jgi:Protein of unknown function (DUF1236)